MKYAQRLFFALIVTMLLVLFSAPLAAQESVSFSKAFVPDTIGPGSVSTLRFDITNNTANPVTGLAFVDNLPASVTIANPANASSNCGGANLSTQGGGSSISLSVGSAGAFQSCSVLVDVTSSTTGTHTNLSGVLTSDTGSYGTASADLTVDDQRPGFSKSFSPSSVEAGERSTLTFTIDNTANASSVWQLNFTDNLPAPIVIASPSNVSKTCPDGVVTANPGAASIAYSGSLELAAGANCTISVDVTANFSGVLNNVSGELTSFVFPTFNNNLNSGKASASLDVNVGDVHLIKTFTDDPVAPGGQVTLEFTILNRSRSDDATGIAFEDDLDGTLTGLAAVGLPLNDVCGAGSVLMGTDNLSFVGGSVPAEGTCTFSVTLQVPTGAISGAYYNATSEITADLGGESFVGNIASDTLFVNPAPVLTKEFLTASAGGGETVTMRFTINSVEAATDIAFEDNLTAFIEGILPGDVSSLPADGFCGIGSTIIETFTGFDQYTLAMSGGSVLAGDSCTFDVDFIVPDGAPGGVTTNTTTEISATIDGATRVGKTASANLTVVSTPKLSKYFIDGPVLPGDTVTLQFTITNLEGTTDATDVAFSDDLESTLITGLAAVGLPQNDVCGPGSLLSGTTVISLTGGTVGLDDVCTFEVTVQVPADALPGRYTNTTGSLTATVAGLVTTGLPASDDLQIAGLELTKSFIDDPVIPGDTVTLEFTLTNTSALNATDILFSDNLSSVLSGLAAISFSPAEPCGTGSTITGTGFIIFQNGSLPAATSCTFSATLQVPAAAANGSYRNVTSDVSATMGGTTIILDPATDDLLVSDQLLSFSKSFDQDTVAPGDNIGLTFTITNLSATDAVTGITFSDDLDAALAGLEATGLPTNDDCGLGSSLSGTDTITLVAGELAAGDFCQFTVTLAVPGDAAFGSLASNVTSEITGQLGAFDVSGEPATDTFKVHAVEFSKAFAVADVYEGDTTTLNFTITNFSDEAVDRMIFSDDLDATLPGLMASGLPLPDVCGPGSSITGTSVLTFSGGVLAPGEFCSFDVSILVPAGATPGSYLNVTSDLTVGGNEIVSLPASDTLVILERPPETVTICHKPGTPAEQTKVIDIDSLKGHLGHGDYLGPCVSEKKVKRKK